MATWGTGISLKGAKGDLGKAGSQTYFVDGQPTDENASAVAGDVAFDQTNQLLFQRGANGWPTSGTLLRGAAGVMGVNGVSFYSGPAAPDASVQGSDGDIYFVLAGKGEVYKRVNGAWVDQNYFLQGPAGADGVAGARGSQTYTGSGAPSSDLSTFSPPAQKGDVYYDTSASNPQAPVIYFLGA